MMVNKVTFIVFRGIDRPLPWCAMYAGA